MKLGEHDRIEAAYAQSASGPGWANQPLWVVIRSALDGSFRIDCIQPHEQSQEMLTLYAVSQAAHSSMTGAVKAHFIRKARKKTMAKA